MTITQSQIDTLAEFFSCTERPDKINVEIDQATGEVVITIDDMDEQWLEELMEWTQHKDGSISDVRVTRATRYRLPWWKRWFMPWTVFRFYRKPSKPFPYDA